MRCYRRWQVLLLAILFNVASFAQTPPQINSESYILIDADTGTVLAENNADLALPPASMTKIMTAHLGFQALENGALSWDQLVRISRRAWAQKVVGSKTFLQVDTNVSVGDLIYGIIVQSGNDASIALAEGLSGDESAFVAAMNDSAQAMRLKNTSFANVTGLPDENHYSSARDIATIIRQTIKEFPEYYKIYAEREFTYNDITQPNRNNLLGNFDGADGVKTGYTKAAGYCLAASAKRGDQRLISVVMKTKSSAARRRESEKLLTFGFNYFVNKRAFDEQKINEIPIFQGDKDFIKARAIQSGLITMTRDKTIKTVFELSTWPLIAPIKQDEILGTLTVYDGENIVQQTDVVAVDAVVEAGFAKYWLDFIKWKYLGHAGDEKLFSQW